MTAKLRVVFAVLMVTLLVLPSLVGAEEQGIPGETIVQNAAPIVTITSPAQGTQVETGAEVSFQADASDPNGTPVTYFWDFDDGWTSNQASPVHSYSSAGTYIVTLTVSDGELTASDSVGITVRSPTTDNASPVETVPPTLTVLAPLENELQKDVIVRVSATDDSGIDPSSIIAKLDGKLIAHTFSDGEIIVSLTDLALGEHQVQISVADLAGNWAQKTISFTVVPPPPATVRLSSLVAGENAIANFENFGIPVRKVVLVPTTSQASALVAIRWLTEKPAELPCPPGVTFAYLELSTDASIDNATIEFTVPRSWLIQNSVGENTVDLYHYSNNEWRKLPTAKVGENSAYIFYSAVSPGLSTFAISGQQVSPVLFATFTLSLPTDPVTGAQASITVHVVNPTSLALSRQFELRFGEAYAVPIMIEVAAGQTRDIPLTLNVAGLQPGTYSVELVDTQQGRTLASGQMVFEGYAPPGEEQPAGSLPVLPLAAVLALVCAAGVVAALWATGRIDLAKLKFRRERIKPPSEIAPKPPKRVAKVSLRAESELGADYLKHLIPIAEELATGEAAPKRIRHRRKPVTPFKIEKAKRRS